MNLDSAIYPRISLPATPGLRWIWNCFLRFAAFSSSEEGHAPSSLSLEQEFRKVITRESATISKICFSYSGSVAEFDDLRQDALINIWRGMQTFRGEASRTTWIYRVTVNSCLSTIRKQIRHQHESLEGLYSLIDGNDSDREAIENLHRIISKLGSQEKAIIMMWLDDLSYDDISEAMGLNRNTVATKIRRIKEKIIKEFKKEELS